MIDPDDNPPHSCPDENGDAPLIVLPYQPKGFLALPGGVMVRCSWIFAVRALPASGLEHAPSGEVVYCRPPCVVVEYGAPPSQHPANIIPPYHSTVVVECPSDDVAKYLVERIGYRLDKQNA